VKLTIDNRSGIHNVDDFFPQVDLNQAEMAVSKLDGACHTLAAFDRGDGWQLMVAGGKDHFVVTLSDGDENLVLRNPDGDESRQVELCTGGQYGDYPENICVGLSQALIVLEKFYGGLERKCDWI
jgi:hypothetical protein